MAAQKVATQHLTIPAPKFITGLFKITGTAPLVGNKFSDRAKQDMHNTQEAGSTSKKGKKREPKNFKRAYEEAIHRDLAGWAGIPAPAFRNALISACKIVGFAMTRAKLSLFVEADGVDADDGTPLVKIVKGQPKYAEHFVRNDNGSADLRARPMWDEGWEANVRIKFDSKNSAGMGWGTWSVKFKE
jgi:hypothetical protein